jgi:hypothetical protein
LKISEPTVSRDISYLKNQAKFIIKNYIDEKLPYEKQTAAILALHYYRGYQNIKMDGLKAFVELLS